MSRDHMPAWPGLEDETIAAGDRTICPNFPECQCGQDCAAQPVAGTARAILVGLVLAAALIGAGLVYVGMK